VLRRGLIVVAALASSCGGKTEPTTQAEAAAPREGDRTQVGVYSCCAKGEDTACCAGAKQGMCFQYGGIYGDCRKEGEQLEAKVICSHCCEGLTRVSIVEKDDAGACVSSAPPSLFVCIGCGDGVCGAGENACNCPSDCPS